MRHSFVALALVIGSLVLGGMVIWASPNPGEDALTFFRRQTVTADTERIKALITQLGDDSFAARHEASVTLTALGGRALAALRDAADHQSDLEVRNRAAVCVEKITTTYDPQPVVTAAHTIAAHKPADAAVVLLDYFPQIANPVADAAVCDALATVAVRDGRAEPAVLKALEEDPPLRRAAAAAALIRAGVADHLPAVRRLLQDADPDARFHVAQALIEQQDRDAMPVLIGVLDKLPRTRLIDVEEMLFRLADETSPKEPYGTTPEERGRFREAWEEWWTDHAARVDVTPKPPGFVDRTLIVLLDKNIAIDLDSEDRERFRIENLNFPLDVQYLPGDRVLVAEHGGGRVTERHRSGTILWAKDIEGPLVARRLPNGNTFMASKTQLLEVDRDGRELWGLPVPMGSEFMRASKLPDGDLAVVLTDRRQAAQRFVRMDARGRVRATFPVSVSTYGGRIDVQADGKVLVPQRVQHRVAECTGDGKVVREFRVSEPIAAVRLPNGHTLVTSMREYRAVEFDAAGREIWDYRADTRVTRCLRR